MPKKCQNCSYKSLLHMQCRECGKTVCQGCFVWETRECYRCFRAKPSPLKRVTSDFMPLDEDEPVYGAMF